MKVKTVALSHFPGLRDGAHCPKKKAGDRPSASLMVTPAVSITHHRDVGWEEAQQHQVYVINSSLSKALMWLFLLTQLSKIALHLDLCQAPSLASHSWASGLVTGPWPLFYWVLEEETMQGPSASTNWMLLSERSCKKKFKETKPS